MNWRIESRGATCADRRVRRGLRAASGRAGVPRARKRPPGGTRREAPARGGLARARAPGRFRRRFCSASAPGRRSARAKKSRGGRGARGVGPRGGWGARGAPGRGYRRGARTTTVWVRRWPTRATSARSSGTLHLESVGVVAVSAHAAAAPRPGGRTVRRRPAGLREARRRTRRRRGRRPAKTPTPSPCHPRAPAPRQRRC